MLPVDFEDAGEDVAGAEQLGLDRAKGQVELLGNLVIAVLLEVPELNQAAVAWLELGHHLAHAVDALLLFEGLAGIEAVVRHLDFHGVALRVGEALVQAQRLDALFPDEVDGPVRGNLEEPGGEGELRAVLLEPAEGLAEGLDHQVLGVVAVVDHLQEHVVNGLPVPLHQFGKGPLIVGVQSPADQAIVVLGLVGEVVDHDRFVGARCVHVGDEVKFDRVAKPRSPQRTGPSHMARMPAKRGW